MTILNTSAYYLRRADEARALAAGAEDRGVRRIHLDMADRYEALAKTLDAPTREEVIETHTPDRTMAG